MAIMIKLNITAINRATLSFQVLSITYRYPLFLAQRLSL